jgi:DNA polymerase-1
MEHVVIDFETRAITGSGAPPEPVGVAIKEPGRAARYLSWGHPTGNNCLWDEARNELFRLWGRPLLFHNAGFDILIAMEYFGLPFPQRYDDTLWVAMFADPYSPTLALKPLAERYLRLPPDERDDVRDWLVAQKIVRKSATKGWGAHIADAPGELVGKYAVGDVSRTAQLWWHLYQPWMQAPVDRERALSRPLIETELRGVLVDRARLGADVDKYAHKLARVDAEVRQLLGAKTLNIDSNEELAAALVAAYGVKLPKTPTGKDSVSKTAIAAAIPESASRLKGLLLYRSALSQSLSTFLVPWLEKADAQGRIHIHWNSVRGASAWKDQSGARTGRLSSEPNLQNVTTDQSKLLATLKQLLGRAPELPVVRSYICAPKGYQLLSVDYSQQELRMLAHYEDGPLANAYRKDPQLDVHEFVRHMIRNTTGVNVERKQTKILNFAIIYGAGIGGLAAQLGTDVATAEQLRNAYFLALPSVRRLMRELQWVGSSGEYITTLGGRRYYAEPARIINGERRTFEYKLLNYLVQGSSADQTKQAVVDWAATKPSSDELWATVHDEILICVPKRRVKRAARELSQAMIEALPLDVPVNVDVEIGDNWGEMHALVAK